jgi:hypothetical protein
MGPPRDRVAFVSDAARLPAEPSVEREPLDLRAIARGAGAALVVVVPAGFGLRAVTQGSSLWSLLFVISLVGFGWGGAVAAKSDISERGLTHGTVAGIVSVAGYLAIGVVSHLVSATSIKVISLAFTALLGVSCAMVGAELGERRRRRLDTDDDGATEPPA